MSRFRPIRRSERLADAGFTLVELLVTIAILGVIMLALTEAFVVVVRSNQATTDRLGQSHDAQLVANYVVQDAQSATGPGTSTSAAYCGATGTPQLSLTWTSIGGLTEDVSYTLTAQTLTRWTCTGSGGYWSGVKSGTVSHNVSALTASCTGGSETCGTGSTATGLSVAVTELQGSAQAYSYQLNAAFRDSIGSASCKVACSFADVALLVLGGGSGSCINMSGNGLVLLGTDQGAAANCSSTYNGSHSGIDNSTGTSGGYVSSTGSCGGTTSQCANWHSPSPPVADPYASQTIPTDTGGTSPTCTSGTINPGTYATLTIDGNCTMATGQYIITDQLNVTTRGKLTSAEGGVLISLVGSDPGSGPNPYVLNLNGNASVDISARGAATDPTWGNFGIVVTRTGTTTLGFTGNGDVTTGGIYAPNSTAILSGGGVFTISQLIVAAIGATGNGTYNVG